MKAVAVTMPRLIGLGVTHFTRLASRTTDQGRLQTNSISIQNTLPANALLRMSDYEDEMDVDAPPAKEAILFSSENTNAKGKRSAANLPVEAEDSLPW